MSVVDIVLREVKTTWYKHDGVGGNCNWASGQP